MKWFSSSSKKNPSSGENKPSADDEEEYERAYRKSFTLHTSYFRNHAYLVGGTGQGKTNFLLLLIEALSRDEVQAKEPCSIIVIDPHGPATIDGARMLVKKHGKEKVMVFDPMHTKFSLNPLEISVPFSQLSEEQRMQKIQNQVGQLVSILVDVLGTDEAKAPRMIWIFRGCLYFLYMFGNDITFLDLYQLLILLMDLTRASRQEVIEKLFENAGVKDDITKQTIEAISNYNAEAYTVVLNRISNFTIPPGSITSRTFCSRKTTIPFDKIMDTPGMVTFFSVSKGDLPADFREVFTNTLLLNVWYRMLERKGKGHQVYLFIDEFQTVQKLEALETIISEGRKFGLSLIAANQTLSAIKRKSLLDSLFGNCSFVGTFTTGPSDARALSELFGKEHYNTIFRLSRGQMMMRLRPSDGSMPRTEVHTFPKAEIPESPKEEELIRYMEEDLEKLYGGALEDKKPKYWEKVSSYLEDLGKCPVTTIQWEILAHLKTWERVTLGSPEVAGHVNTGSHIQEELKIEHGWKLTEIGNAFRFLEDVNLIRGEQAYGKMGNKGKDVDPRPNVVSDLSRSMDTFYTLTDDARAKYFSPLKAVSSRAGGLVHLKAIQKRREEYWANMEFVMVDLGEKPGKRPDIMVFRAEQKSVQTKDGGVFTRESEFPELYIAEEIETDPLRHKDRVLRNYAKNYSNYHHTRAGMFRKIRFDVLMEEHVEPIKEILKDKDSDSYTVAFLPLGFSKEELLRRLGQEDLDSSKEQASRTAPSDEASKTNANAPSSTTTNSAATKQSNPQDKSPLPSSSEPIEKESSGKLDQVSPATTTSEGILPNVSTTTTNAGSTNGDGDGIKKMLQSVLERLDSLEKVLQAVVEPLNTGTQAFSDLEQRESEKTPTDQYDKKETPLASSDGEVASPSLLEEIPLGREEIHRKDASKQNSEKESSNSDENADAKKIIDRFVNCGIVEPDEDSFTITLEEAARALKKSRIQVYRYFSKLKDEGYVRKVGQSGYKLTELARAEIKAYLSDG